MVRSFVFTTQGKLHSKDVESFLMPTLLSDTKLFLWVDLEHPTPDETNFILNHVFHFHPLSVEDCIADSPVPKVDEYSPKDGDSFSPYLFIVVHAVDYSRRDGVFATKELNFFLGKNFLVTFHTVPMRAVTATEDRCLKGTLHVARAPDRVAHTLLHELVENYKPALDELAVEIAQLEEQALQNPDRATLNKIIQTKKEVLHLRQIIGPQHEVLTRFATGEFELIRAHLVPYYRDVADRLRQISDLAQRYTDSLTGILQVFLNMSSNQTGEVIKVLTLITMITTPVTIIGTWYGMNFKNMPELEWKHGYLVAMILTLVSTAATVYYFRRRKWM